ncbi:MAG: RHS repeat protein [Bacteroidia bacterium]|nr:RHS repeat protein [Bacteroidia bacterium]
MKKITDFGTNKSIITSYSYNLCGFLTEINSHATGLQIRNTKIEYDPTGRFIIKETNSLNQSVTMQYEPSMGLLLSRKGITGLTTSYKYDGFGRLIETITPQGHKITRTMNWEIDDTKPTQVYSVTTAIPGLPNSKLFYDIYDREILNETDGFNGTIASHTYYNTAGQVQATSKPYYPSTESQILTHYLYNKDRLYAIGVNDFAVTTYIGYNGTTTTTVNPADQQFSKTTDVFGNITNASDLCGEISYTCNSAGKIITMDAIGSSWSMGYDNFIYQNKLTDEDAGEINYIYNAYGELESQTDARSNNFLMTYDKLSRIETKTGADDTINYDYYTTGNGTGMLKSITAPNIPGKTYKYDTYYNIVEINEDIEGQPFETKYEYNIYGNITKIIYPSGFSVIYEYDQNSYLTAVKRDDTQAMIWQAAEYNALGMATRYTSGNGLQTDVIYEPVT